MQQFGWIGQLETYLGQAEDLALLAERRIRKIVALWLAAYPVICDPPRIGLKWWPCP
jgi:hypothetical protein